MAPNPQGKKTSHVVAENVEQLRVGRRWSYTELSRRLDLVGHALNPVVLQRVTKGQRRIDVEDLTALARVFDTTPAALLTPKPRTKDEFDLVTEELPELLTGLPPVTYKEVMAWVSGELNDLRDSTRLEWAERTVKRLEREIKGIERLMDEEGGADLESQAQRHMLDGERIEAEQERLNYDEWVAVLERRRGEEPSSE